jgi:outer membrane receptor protein involved in Fe transport
MKSALYLASALSLVAGAQANPALAQTAVPEDTEASVPEILVVARKREESLDDVPASVSALSAADQENLVLDGMGDYLRQTAGVLLVSSGPDYLADISIRGQGGGRNGFSESATGVYRNGIFVAGGGFGGRSFNRLDYFDNARVEVYRGPQGALYGRNAVGGAVNVVSNRPTMDLGLASNLEYGAADRLKLEGIVNGALIEDRVSVRLGGLMINQRGGDIVDINTLKILDSQKYEGGRAQLLTKIASGWEARLTYEVYSSEAAGFTALGQRLAAGLPAGRVSDPSPYLRNASRVGRVKINDKTFLAELDGEVGFANLAAVFVHKNRDGRRLNEDLDHFLGLEGLAGVDMIGNQSEDFKRDGAEIRLSSNGDGPLNWLVGTDYQDTLSDAVAFNGGTVPATSSAALRSQAVRRDTALEKLTSWSIFGSIDYAISNRFSAGIELRSQRDEKNFRFQRIDLVTGPVQTSNPVWQETLPVASIRYKLGDNSNLYARYATGFRPGGFNQGVTNLAQLEYNPETAQSFEMGFKGRIPDLRMRFGVVGYYTITDDMQVVTAASATDTTFTLSNVAGAKQWGAEAELSGIVTLGNGRLNYNLSAATQDGRFDDGSTIIVTGQRVDISGGRVNRARDLTLNLSSFYSHQLWDGVDLVVGGSLRAERGGYENATGGTTHVSGRKLENFTNIDARISLKSKAWQLSAFGKNLTDKTYIIQNVNGNNYYNERARYGVELSFKFGGEQ